MDNKKATPEGQEKIQLFDINTLKESARVINASLNKGCKGGQYNLNEAFAIKLACDNINAGVAKLEELQNYLVNVNKKKSTQQ